MVSYSIYRRGHMDKRASGLVQTIMEVGGAGLCLMLAGGALAGGLGGVVAAKIMSKSPEDIERLKAEYNKARADSDMEIINAQAGRELNDKIYGQGQQGRPARLF